MCAGKTLEDLRLRSMGRRDRLEARAELIVAREQQPQRPMPPAQQAVRVEQAVENLTQSS